MESVPCEIVEKFLKSKGFNPSSAIIDGVRRWDKDHSCVFIRCVNGEMSFSTIKTNILSKINVSDEDFDNFIKVI